MKEFRNTYKILVGKSEVRRPISRPRLTLGDIIKIVSSINKEW
jgi:hypothetical protein